MTRTGSEAYVKLVRRMRFDYPYVAYRPHSKEPSPLLIDRQTTFGDFARIPGSEIDEWRFSGKEARDHFIRGWGGSSE